MFVVEQIAEKLPAKDDDDDDDGISIDASAIKAIISRCLVNNCMPRRVLTKLGMVVTGIGRAGQPRGHAQAWTMNSKNTAWPWLEPSILNRTPDSNSGFQLLGQERESSASFQLPLLADWPAHDPHYASRQGPERELSRWTPRLEACDWGVSRFISLIWLCRCFALQLGFQVTHSVCFTEVRL